MMPPVGRVEPGFDSELEPPRTSSRSGSSGSSGSAPRKPTRHPAGSFVHDRLTPGSSGGVSGPIPPAASHHGHSSIHASGSCKELKARDKDDRPGQSPGCTPEHTSDAMDQASDHPPEPRRPLHLLTLPPEILLLILRHVSFADIVRLRRTCKPLRSLASPQQIRILLGPDRLRAQLLGHCRNCLVHDPFRARLLQQSHADPGYPLASRCLDCALKARDPRIRVGRKVTFANFETVWVCRWCGWPVTEGAAFGSEQFHRVCYKRYKDCLFGHLILGVVQLGLGIVAAALAWRYFRHVVMVLAPTVTGFILLWVCLVLVAWRNRRRTYHWSLVMELAILGLWIPPVYYLGTEIARAGDQPVPRSTQAALAMFALNMLFRLFNVLGNIVILSRFDTTEWHRTGVASWKRPLCHLARVFVFWTYPYSLEEKPR